jgi:adenosine deaminase
MRGLLLIATILLAGTTRAQEIDRYFERIRGNEAELTAFCAQMPKGGDLHHHYTGSVYAESYIQTIVDSDYYLNTATLKVSPKAGDGYTRISALIASGNWPTYDELLLQKWSVKDYNGVSYPCDKQFFETFGNFGVASSLRLDSGLLELKRRAVSENVSYIETMFTGIPAAGLRNIGSGHNAGLHAAMAAGNEALVMRILDTMYNALIDKGAATYADSFNEHVVGRLHKKLHIDDATFTMRYQNYVSRVQQPADVFKGLVLGFISADHSPLVVGVNIVAPENDDVSMHDYKLHMLMYKYLHRKYPDVRYAMHAGELALGMVKPEEMTWHIHDAVYVAGATRIGHGVDIPYEHDCYSLLNYMAQHLIAIEINLYSNEFILKVKGNAHPIELYYKHHVPIVICTDDAGVLRSNLTRQYVLLAKRYKFLKYADIKQFVYNSITYSFIEEPEVKEKLKTQLDQQFTTFEQKVLAGNSEE